LTVKPLFFFPADLPNTIQKNIGKNKYTLDNIWKKMNKKSSGTSLKDEYFDSITLRVVLVSQIKQHE
jgi:hypothetical protein